MTPEELQQAEKSFMARVEQYYSALQNPIHVSA
jgi:hypothetical protein